MQNSITTDCPFCKIISGSDANRIIARNDFAFAVRDGYPITAGHTLIIPARHFASIFEASAAEQQALAGLLVAVKGTLDKELSPPSFNIGINDGPEAGQTVNHVHIHLIPRYKGDVVDPRGGVRWIIPEKANYWDGRA